MRRQWTELGLGISCKAKLSGVRVPSSNAVTSLIRLVRGSPDVTDCTRAQTRRLSLSCPKYRVLMGSAGFSECRTPCHNFLEYRIGVDHIGRPRILSQRVFQISNNLPQPRLRQRIEQKNHQRFVRKNELDRVPAKRLHFPASPLLTGNLAYVLRSDGI